MRCNILTTMSNGSPALPPMSSENGYCLRYDDNGTIRGGYTVLCQAPRTPNTVIVQVECSQEVFDQMIDDPELDIQWWEEIIDDTN